MLALRQSDRILDITVRVHDAEFIIANDTSCDILAMTLNGEAV